MDIFESALFYRHHGGMVEQKFEEYFRCYPVAMMPGPDRDDANHGGKIFLPPSALDRLARLHISYPMLFEIVNTTAGLRSHAGVLEFIAEEGKVYLPYWLMQILLLQPGDLVQIKSTDLPSGTFIKLQPQSPEFLNISDPKAVLENAFRNFSCLTTGDIFTFSYNDTIYSVAVLETRPDNPKHAICTLETDLSVDFAPPVGYVEPERQTHSGLENGGTGDPTSNAGFTSESYASTLNNMFGQGPMAKEINYAAIAPDRNVAKQYGSNIRNVPLSGQHFQSKGRRLVERKSTAANKANSSTTLNNNPKPSEECTNSIPTNLNRIYAPLRLPHGQLFFGYAILPVPENGIPDDSVNPKSPKQHFLGSGNSLNQK